MDPLNGKRLDDEIRHHIEERTERLVAAGMDPDEARREARRAFGDVDAVREELARIDQPRRGWFRATVDRVHNDLAFTLRQFRRSPGFALVAVLTLGLGIGAATAIFGLVKAVVLEPLPYPDSGGLVFFNETTPDGSPFSLSDPNFLDYRERLRSLDHLTAVSRADLTLMQDGRPTNVVAALVTGSFFPLFGGDPARGRTFTDAESGTRPARVVVVGHAFWRDHLGGDPDVVGRALNLDGEPYEVIGVMPPAWQPLEQGDVWIPLDLSEPDRGDHTLAAVGRLAPGVTLQAATNEAHEVARSLGEEFPASNRDWGALVRPMKDVLLGPERIQAGWVLLGAVGLLLLLACASVSNLLLARASTRGREMDLRLTLGASRLRLLQQLLTESLALAGAGAVAGIALAYVLLPVLQAVSPADTPRIGDARVDAGVMLFAVAVALATGTIFGAAPALHALRRDRGSTARQGGVRTGGSERARTVLVTAQVAVSLTLLFGTGALGASFRRLQGTDSGLDEAHTMVVPLMLSGDRYTFATRKTTVGALEERLAALPGVAAVGTSNIRPFSGSSTVINLAVEGRPTTPQTAPFVRWRAVSRTYFAAAAAELLEGRLLERADFDDDAEDVVVVSRSLARNLFGSARAALNERLAFGWDGTNWRRIVGVVTDMEDRELATEPPPTLYIPGAGAMNWAVLLVRYQPGADPADAAAIRQAIWSVDPGLPVPSVEPLSELVARSVAGPRFNLLVMAVFGSVALLLSLPGIYGLVLFAVRQRTREIGVRLALGARASGVVGLMLLRGIRITTLGVAGGVGLSLLLGRYLDALVFGGEESRGPLLAAAAATVAITAMLATWLPARRATRVDPREALTAE